MMRILTIGLIAVALCIGSTGCQKRPGGDDKKSAASETTKAATSKDGVDVELYVMSQCPYGVMALDAILPAVEKLGSGVNLKIDYIGQKKPDGTLESMHGPNEVEGDILQLCAGSLAKEKQYAFIGCLNKNWRTIPKDWEACAEEAGLDVQAMKACKDGAEGKKLLAESFDRSAKAGAQGSPTIKLAGSDYRGGRKTADFMRGICGAFGDKAKPAACNDIPKPPEVTVTAITDKRCKECNADEIVTSLKDVFPGLKPKILDWSDDEAKTIAKDAEIKLLPAVLFDDSIDKDKEGAQHMARWLQPAGKYKSLRLGAEFDPTAEICDNQTDDTGNGKVDCADDTCKESMLCREEKKGVLDVFVMSQCPYGVMGLDAMKDVLDAFGEELTFGIHYIAEETPNGFESLHGQPEVDENIRELCAIKHYGEKNKYMDYVWCRNKNIRSDDWKSCTGSNDIDTKVIEKCSTGDEGKKLLSENLKLAKTLKIGGSPTWLVNNRMTFNAVSAGDIQKKICEKNPDLKGCKAELKGAAPNAAPAGSCGG